MKEKKLSLDEAKRCMQLAQDMHMKNPNIGIRECLSVIIEQEQKRIQKEKG